MIISCETDARRGVPCYVTEGRWGSRRTVLTPWPPGADPGGCQVSGEQTGAGEDCEKFDVKMKTEFLVNCLLDHNPIWKYIELLLFFSNFAWTFQETGGDMEEWGGQEKGICQGAVSTLHSRLTQNMRGEERVARGLTSVTQGGEKCN